MSSHPLDAQPAQEGDEPKRRTILVLGAGPDDAAMFENSLCETVAAYSAAGYAVVLVAPDFLPITTANRFYQLPLIPEFLERVIATERPQSIVISAAGQSALAAGLELEARNILRRYSVSVLGTPSERLLELTERPLGLLELGPIGTDVQKSIACHTLDESLRAAEFLGYPVLVRDRDGFAAEARDVVTLKEHVRHALLSHEEVLIQESTCGWRELQFIVAGDQSGQTRVLAELECFDPQSDGALEPIFITPIQSLPDTELLSLRSSAESLAATLGIIGVSTVSVAVERRHGHRRLLTLTPRLSRSVGIAARVRGLPLSRLAAELTLGKLLDTHSLPSPASQPLITISLPAVSPRPGAGRPEHPMHIATGEVMASGTTFIEALQSAIRMQSIGADGLLPLPFTFTDLRRELTTPGPRRLLAIANAMEGEWSVQELAILTGIDLHYLKAIEECVTLKRALLQLGNEALTEDLLWRLKRAGFSDRSIAAVRSQKPEELTDLRRSLGVRPKLRTAYVSGPNAATFYLSYSGEIDRALPVTPILITAPGPTASAAGRSGTVCLQETLGVLRAQGEQPILLTPDPWSVRATDNTTLILTELSPENVAEIATILEPKNVVTWTGGEIPAAVIAALGEAGTPLLGTAASEVITIDDPRRLAALCTELGLPQPDWREAADMDSALAAAELAGYPILIRGSRGLTKGRTVVARTAEELRSWLGAPGLGRDAHMMMARAQFGESVDIDAVAQDGALVALSIAEHVERFALHDDSASTVLPAQMLTLHMLRQLKTVAGRLAAALNISGPFSLQFLTERGSVFLLGIEMRLSRNAALVPLACGQNLPRLAIEAALGLCTETNVIVADSDHVVVQVGQNRTRGETTRRRSTVSLGETTSQALLTGFVGLGLRPPERSLLLCIDSLDDLTTLLPTIRNLHDKGFVLLATTNAHEFLQARSIPSGLLYRPSEPRSPNVMEYVEQKRLDLAVVIPPLDNAALLEESLAIRASAAKRELTLIESTHLFAELGEALVQDTIESLPCRPNPYATGL